jgi:hypothetical protein
MRPPPAGRERAEWLIGGPPMWVIVQTGYRKDDGSAYGYGTAHAGPTRKLTAGCRTEAGARRWLRRLERWASEGVGRSYHAALVPTYEAMTVAGLAGLEPASFVGPAYYGDHGREAALRAIVLGVRESHTALRRLLRRRGPAAVIPTETKGDTR